MSLWKGKGLPHTPAQQCKELHRPLPWVELIKEIELAMLAQLNIHRIRLEEVVKNHYKADYMSSISY